MSEQTVSVSIIFILLITNVELLYIYLKERRNRIEWENLANKVVNDNNGCIFIYNDIPTLSIIELDHSHKTAQTKLTVSKDNEHE